MSTVRGASARGTIRRVIPEATSNHAPALGTAIREALHDYLRGKQLVEVRVREVEGRKVEGFLKITGEKNERLLVDFRANSTPQGELSSLEVGGRNIVLESAPRNAASKNSGGASR